MHNEDHIPGAKNIMLSKFFEPETNLIRSKEDVQAVLSDIDLKKPLICQCQTGLTSTYLYAAICHYNLNENPSLLDGGFGFYKGSQNK
jgi:3-mercaptopyruvate sulfurtransferase SseA